MFGACVHAEFSNASGERRLGEQIADSLKKIIAPYLLRRTKAEVKAEARTRGRDGIIVAGPE